MKEERGGGMGGGSGCGKGRRGGVVQISADDIVRQSMKLKLLSLKVASRL